MFTGSIPALVTPMRGGEVDENSLRAFIDWQIDEGSNALVPVGTTGESPTLSHDEHKRVVLRGLLLLLLACKAYFCHCENPWFYPKCVYACDDQLFLF